MMFNNRKTKIVLVGKREVERVGIGEAIMDDNLSTWVSGLIGN